MESSHYIYVHTSGCNFSHQIGCSTCKKNKKKCQKWDSNPRPEGTGLKPDALDSSAILTVINNVSLFTINLFFLVIMIEEVHTNLENMCSDTVIAVKTLVICSKVESSELKYFSSICAHILLLYRVFILLMYITNQCPSSLSTHPSPSPPCPHHVYYHRYMVNDSFGSVCMYSIYKYTHANIYI